jgi:hypothetical protein
MPSRIKRRPSVFSPAKLRRIWHQRFPGVTYEEAAALCSQASGEKISSRILRYYAMGKCAPGSAKLCALAAWLRVDVSDLFDGQSRVSRRATPKRIGVGSASAVSAGTVPEPAAKTSKGQS